jgi:hypothetical protein
VILCGLEDTSLHTGTCCFSYMCYLNVLDLALGISFLHFSTNVALLSHTFLWLILHLGGFFAVQDTVSKLCSVLFHTLLVHATFLIDMSTSVVRKQSNSNISYSHVLNFLVPLQPCITFYWEWFNILNLSCQLHRYSTNPGQGRPTHTAAFTAM